MPRLQLLHTVLVVGPLSVGCSASTETPPSTSTTGAAVAAPVASASTQLVLAGAQPPTSSASPPLTNASARISLSLRLPAPKDAPSRCSVVKPGQRSLDHPSRRNTCVILSGWWGVGALIVPETRDDILGARILRPLSFVRDTNPSLGWPSWAALDTVLVDVGWVPEAEIESTAMTLAASDPLFLRHDATVYGRVRPAPAIDDATWEVFQPLLARADAYPFGDALTGIYVEWNDA